MNRARIVKAVRSTAKKKKFDLTHIFEVVLLSLLLIVLGNQVVAKNEDRVVMLNTVADYRELQKQLTTDEVTEGQMNLYFTQERAYQVFENWLKNLTTDDVKEGHNNYYFTVERARNVFVGNYPIAYNSITGVISLAHNSISPAFIKSSNNPIADYILSYDAISGNFKWIAQQDTLSALSCASGQVVKWDGTSWVCADDMTSASYTAGNGLQLTGTEFSVNAPTCNVGEVLTWDGTQFACVQDQDTDTTYTAGRGLTLTGTTFETNTPTTSCASGEVLTWDGNNFVCTADNTQDADNDPTNELNTAFDYDAGNYNLSITDAGGTLSVDLSSLHDVYTAGMGLDLTGNTFSLNASIDLLTDVDTSTNAPIAGQVLKWDGNNWVPQDDNDTLANLTCSNGQIAKWNGSAWVCAEDNDTNTTYTAGNGLQLTGTEFSVNAPTCNAGEVLTWDGTQFACVQDQDTDTTYAAGRGLTLTGTTFETNTPTTSCASGEVLTWDGNNFVCTADQDTTYTASGTLLQLTGTTFSIKEGTLTDGSLCTYDATNGLVCNTDVNSVGTDNQTLSWDATNNQLSISNGNTVDLSDLQQTLNFDNSTGELSISEGNSVDLSTFWDNTDNQTLSLSGNTLSISGGNSVTFTNWDTDATDDVKNLTDLQDVTITNPNAAEVLRYDGSTWINSLLKFIDLADTPNDYGSAGQVLATDGSGNLFWRDMSQGIFDTDMDTGMWVEKSTDEDWIRFDTAGTERMFITNDGRINITKDTFLGITNESTSPSADYSLSIGARANNETSRSTHISFVQTTGNGGYIDFYTYQQGAVWSDVRMRLTHAALEVNVPVYSGSFVIPSSNNKTSLSDGVLHLASPNDNYIRFTDDGAVFLGALGYVDGDRDLVYKSGATTIRNGTERFRITSNGNVVINQAYTLPNADGNAGQVLSTDGSGTVSWVDATSLGYWQKNGTSLSPKTAGDDILLNSGETLTISDFTKGGLIFAGDNGLLTQDASNLYWDIDNSRLGIGTTTPQASLHVMGGEIWLFNDGNNPRFVIGDNGNTGEYGWLQWDSANNYFRIDTSNSSATGLKVADNTLAIGNIYPASDSVLILANDSTEVFRVYDNGNIKTTLAGNSAVYTDSNGILTTTVPTSGTLGYWQRSGTDLTPSNAGDNLIIDGTTTLNGDVNISGSIVSNILPQNASLYDIGSSSTPWQNVFADNLHGNLQTNLTVGSVTFIDSSGNLAENNSQLYWDATNNRLGIGTNSPSTKLQIVGQTRSSSFASANGTAGSPAYRFYNDANTGLFLPAADNLAFATSGIERLRIDSTGQVGINTTTPQASLEVNGTLIVRDISTFYNDLLIRSSSNYPLEVDYGDGSDGDVNITSADTVVNVYSYVTDTNLNSGATTVHVEDTSDFNNNDLVLIIQMQDYNNPSNVGVYEFKRVTVVDATTLQLNAGLDHSYTSGADNTTNAQVTQVIRVPEYNNLTIDDGASITAQAWDGKTGGIVVFKVLNNLTFNGSGKVDVTAKGYRGGSCNGCGNNAWGQQGEGITGLGQNSLSKNANGGGGGYGPSGYGGEPGAGGGCGTSGKDGISSYTSEGGDAVCSPDKLIMGGGAGAGGDDDNRTPLPQYVDGAGAVFVVAKSISNANIVAKGEDGIAPGSAGGTTGGGAGGTVKLYFTNYSENSIDVSGGKGGVDSDDTGGDGGEGLIVKKYQEETSLLFFADVSSGNIGIRKSSPEYELDVGGTVRAVNYLTFSDQRLKTNIHNFADNTLSKLQKINPVIYKLKISNDSRYKYGLLAQQVQKYFPELVYKDKKGILAIDYQGFIAPLLKGVQELTAKVVQLEARVNALEQMVNNGTNNFAGNNTTGNNSNDNSGSIFDNLFGLKNISLLNKLDKELKQLQTKLETKHVVSKTVRTELLQVDKDFIAGKDVAGSVVLKAGKNSITVEAQSVNNRSVIIVTEEFEASNLNNDVNYVPYVVIKQDHKFTIKINKPYSFDVKFNYMIINSVVENRQQATANIDKTTSNGASCSQSKN